MSDDDKIVDEAEATPVRRGFEYITSDFIDMFMDTLRKGYLSDFFETNQKWLVKIGLYGLYVSAVLGLLGSIILVARFEMPAGLILGTGLGFLLFCLIAHYLAVKFLPTIDQIIENTPTRLASRAFLDSAALVLCIVGVAAFITGLVLAFSRHSFSLFLGGLFVFIYCEYLVSICLKPALVNIKMEQSIGASEEFLGLLSLFIKGSLKLVPIVFGSAVIFGIYFLLATMFASYPGEAIANAGVAQSTYLLALSPVFGYLTFLTYYFLVGLAMAVLSLGRHEAKG